MAKGRVDLGTLVKVCSPCTRLHVMVVFVTNTQTAHSGIQSWDLYTAVTGHVTTRLLSSVHQDDHSPDALKFP